MPDTYPLSISFFLQMEKIEETKFVSVFTLRLIGVELQSKGIHALEHPPQWCKTGGVGCSAIYSGKVVYVSRIHS